MTKSPAQRARPALLEHDYEVTPGEYLRAELSTRGVSQADLAVRAGVSAKHLNQVVQDVVPLSPDTALRLERALGISADLLAQLDASQQAKKGRNKAEAKLSDYKAWFAEFSLPMLLEHHVVTAKATVEHQIEELLAFFGVAEPSGYEKMYAESLQSFRRAQHLNINAHATAIWLRLAERKAETLALAPYVKIDFAALLTELPSLTLQPLAQSFPVLQQRCSEVGVAVVYTPSLAGTRASAAVRWLGPERPVIALTGRGRYEDSVWFSFFHESGHVIHHPKRKSVIEFEGDDDGDGAETLANNYAKKTLLRGRVKELSTVTTAAEVKALAEDLDIHPGIPAGIRAYELGNEGFRRFAKLRRKLDDASLA